MNADGERRQSGCPGVGSGRKMMARLGKVAVGGIAAVSVLAVVVVLWLAVFKRMNYPFELEVLENAMVCHVERVMEGKPLYAVPSLEFAPLMYTPFYYYVAAAVARVTELDFRALRLVSILASLAAFTGIYLIVRRRTSSAVFGIIAVGLFAAMYRVGGAWYDVGRVDSLFTACVVLGIFAAQSRRPAVGGVVAPLLFYVAFMTKQSGLGLGLMLGLHALVFRPKPARWLFLTVFGGAVLVTFVAMNGATDGWFNYYVFWQVATQPVEPYFLVEGFWMHDVARPLGVSLLFATASLCWKLGRRDWHEGLFDIAVVVGSILTAWSSRVHAGGYDNVLMPMHAVVAVYGAVGAFQTLALARKWGGARVWVASGLACQFVSLFYWPHRQVPTEADRKAGECVLVEIGKYPGEVFVPEHPWYLRLVGKSVCAPGVGLTDILITKGDAPEKRLVESALLDGMRGHRYSAVFLDVKVDVAPYGRWIAENYRLHRELDCEGGYPVTGARSRPRYVYVPRRGMDHDEGR